MLTWLIEGGAGPALVGLPVNWAGQAGAGLARRWFRRLRRSDDLSRLVRAAVGSSAEITHAEFDAVRRLLEDQQTWDLLGNGSVADLADRIAGRLSQEGRGAEEAHVAALTIAHGLLEFAVADLDPKGFQQVLIARLRRMETDSASALDAALFGLHADLVARTAAQGEFGAEHFTRVMAHLKRVLDQLPPGPADRGEIAVYLTTLIDGLNTDPWPRDRRFDGPALTPAAIERELRVTVAGELGGQDFDADGVAGQCQRLVILGGPGSGKTWLAKRTARRCAEDALAALTAGGTLDQIELPLYTTCSRLFNAGGDIRTAVVSSAFDQLGDLGGSRLSVALRVFFSERNAPILLVIDSLDEAHGSDERIRQADTLPWRIVLTSRPSSWNHQLIIRKAKDSHRIGELQPLRYPGDVEPFITRWFEGRPDWGNDLAAQLARRPSLQQAATVPLILAFYCIVGGGTPLPDFRRDLHTRVLARMLTGRWRGTHGHLPDAGTCMRALQGWAWSGARSNPISGIGTWADDIATESAGLSDIDEEALDHVAPPMGPPDVDTGRSMRRFIHRSIREQLVAAHVAGLPLEEASDVLLPHLWYDPDWEYSAPAAVAMHPQRDPLLRDVICQATRSARIPADLTVIDAGWEFREFLARVAAESDEADWSPDIARVIGQARVELARAGRTSHLGDARGWADSNREARSALLTLLVNEDEGSRAALLAAGIAQLDPTTEDRCQAREALLDLLPRDRSGGVSMLASGVVQLASTREERNQVRDALLGLLVRETSGYRAASIAEAVSQLAPTAEDRRQVREVLLRLLAPDTSGLDVKPLLGGVIRLAPAAEDKRQVREVLLGLLARDIASLAADPEVAVVGGVALRVSQLLEGAAQFAPATEDKRQVREALVELLTSHRGFPVIELTSGLVRLASTAEDKRQVCGALLRLLASETEGFPAAELAGGIVQVNPAAEDKRRTREVLLRLLTSEIDGWTAYSLATRIIQLDPTAEDNRQTRDVLLGVLARETQADVAADLTDTVGRLSPTPEERRQARGVLLGLLASHAPGIAVTDLASRVAQLASTAEDKRQAREALLRLLVRDPGWLAVLLVPGVVQLTPTADDKRQVRETLLKLLAGKFGGEGAEAVVNGLLQLSATAGDKRQAREALLRFLAHETDREDHIEQVAGVLAQLDPTPEDQRQAREALLGILDRDTYITGTAHERLVGRVVQLAPAAEDKRWAREALLKLLTVPFRGWEKTDHLTAGVAQLALTAEDKSQAREALLKLLARNADYWLARGVVQLAPTAHDLKLLCTRGVQPPAELLAAARSNSALADWLATLPSLTQPQG